MFICEGGRHHRKRVTHVMRDARIMGFGVAEALDS